MVNQLPCSTRRTEGLRPIETLRTRFLENELDLSEPLPEQPIAPGIGLNRAGTTDDGSVDDVILDFRDEVNPGAVSPETVSQPPHQENAESGPGANANPVMEFVRPDDRQGEL